MKRKVNKYRPCNVRTISFSIISFMLFFVSMVGVFPSVEEKSVALYFAIFFFLLSIIFILYSLFKLNSFVYIDDDKIIQKKFWEIIDIKYDEITNIKLSFAYYIRAPYAIKVYNNKKAIMFEITSRVFDEFMRSCSNIEVKNKIDILLKEKGIY